MKLNIALRKMSVRYKDVVEYSLDVDEQKVIINESVGNYIKIKFQNEIHCVECGKNIEKTFHDGFCYNCFQLSPSSSPCIIRPELCRGHLKEGRDVMWELKNHVQPHVVYLSLTSNIKVGVTRVSNTYTRWIDQGSWKIIKFATTNNRYEAGRIEMNLKQHISDKTNWRKMLTNEPPSMFCDLQLKKEELKSIMPLDLVKYFDVDNKICEIQYPVINYPNKVKSINLKKEPIIEKYLVGIRGQYLIFGDSSVFNIRRHSGYLISLEL